MDIIYKVRTFTFSSLDEKSQENPKETEKKSKTEEGEKKISLKRRKGMKMNEMLHLLNF